jgi:hypothetical protein
MNGRRPPGGLRARPVRLAGFALVVVTTAGAAAFLLLPLAVRLFVRGLLLTTNACIWLAATLSSGAGWWEIAGTVAGSTRDALGTSEAIGAAGALVVVGAVALWGLQRLLGSEEKSR